MAEEVGFEPTVACTTTVFKTAPLNHSGTPPHEEARVFYRNERPDAIDNRCFIRRP